MEKSVAEYIVQIVQATRQDPRLRIGISPRGSLTLYRTAQAKAYLEGRDYILPEDIRALASPVLAHRVLLDTKARYSGQLSTQIIDEALEKTFPPKP